MDKLEEIPKCEICNHKLSRYNPANICFCHPEHPDYDQEKIDRKLISISRCAGHNTPGLNRIRLDYYWTAFEHW
tara:strand:- start:3957 stop:4178 length:222 start_codon:yes stop_codon:yes gene_type:complete